MAWLASRTNPADRRATAPSSSASAWTEVLLAAVRRRYRRGELQLDAVGVFERQDVDTERRQARDHAMGHGVLIEQRGRLLQVLPAGHTEAEMIKTHPVRVEMVSGRRHRPQPHNQVAADHHHAAEQDAEHLLRRRVAGRGRLHRHLKAEQAGIELAAALHVGHRQPQVMDVTGWNLPWHCALLPRGTLSAPTLIPCSPCSPQSGLKLSWPWAPASP